MNAGVVIVLIALAVGYLIYRKVGFGNKEDLPQCHSESSNCAECGSSGGWGGANPHVLRAKAVTKFVASQKK